MIPSRISTTTTGGLGRGHEVGQDRRSGGEAPMMGDERGEVDGPRLATLSHPRATDRAPPAAIRVRTPNVGSVTVLLLFPRSVSDPGAMRQDRRTALRTHAALKKKKKKKVARPA